MPAHGDTGRGQMPLSGAILCCTAIPPEKRTELAAMGVQMGAVHKLDLTSDVTHLIVGNIQSKKYEYVARSREDVKVLLPEWLEAIRLAWMKGDDVDVAVFEDRFRVPTFYGLKICLTGFDDLEQRKYISDTAVENGAEYHGDLTKAVTHLITRVPYGKKYEHAVNWKIKTVAYEWFQQSLERGMILEEKRYHTTLPVEERGRHAWEHQQLPSPTLGKRTRAAESHHANRDPNPHRRKLRRSASSKMGSQSKLLWADITAGGFDKKRNEADEWADDTFAGLPTSTKLQANESLLKHHQITQHDDGKSMADPANSNNSDSNEQTGIFKGRITFLHGFDEEKTRILRQHLVSNGAIVTCEASKLAEFPLDHLRNGYLVIPNNIVLDLAVLPEIAGKLSVVTNWWVEQCLFGKCLVDPIDNVLCRPFHKLGINGFDGLCVSSTAFASIELLQMTKIVELMGAKYDETLTPETSVLVCNSRNANPEKLKFATRHRIPAVYSTWLWDCINAGELQPFDDYILNSVPLKKEVIRKSSFAEVPTAPLSEEDSAKLREKKKHAHAKKAKPRPVRSEKGNRAPKGLELATCADLTSTSITASRSHIDSNEITSPTNPFTLDLEASIPTPLQDIAPEVNSPRRPSTTSTSASSSDPKLKSRSSSVVEGRLISVPVSHSSSHESPREPTNPPGPKPRHANDSVIPADSAPESEKSNYANIMKDLLARKKAATSNASEKYASADSRANKRKQLGRAASRNSSLSRSSSTNVCQPDSVISPEESEEQVNQESDMPGFSANMASQSLLYEDPDVQAQREEMIRRMGGKVEEGGGLVRPIGVVRDMADNGSSLGRTGRRRRL